jgi:hypothetical protein
VDDVRTWCVESARNTLSWKCEIAIIGFQAHFSNSHFEFCTKMLLMKLVNPFNVAENDISLSTQCLRDVIAKQFLHIILDDIVQ